MKQEIWCFALLSVIAAIALAPGTACRQSATIDSPKPRDSGAVQPHTAQAAKPNGPAAVPPAKPLLEPTPKPAEPDKSASPADAEAEAGARKSVQDNAAREVRTNYLLLLGDLDLTPEQRESLVSLLVEHSLSSSTIWHYSQGKPLRLKFGERKSADQRSAEIAAVIGDTKRRQFEELERNLGAYRETHQVESLLKSKGAPLSKQQRDGMFALLVAKRDPGPTTPPSGVKPSPMESLEANIARANEGERHVLELAPSVLSAKQVEYLFQQYQYRSEQRARAVNRQKKRRAEQPNDDTPLSYPVF